MPRIPLRVTITRARSWYLASGKSKSEINRAFKEAGQEVGKLWSTKFALKHFQPGATARYQYKRRGYRWNRFKIDEKEYRNPFDNIKRPILKPQPWNLVCCGQFKERVETGRGGFRVHSTAKGNKANEQLINVYVRIPLPHPLNPKYASKGQGKGKDGTGDMVRLIRAESIEMGRLLMQKVQEKLGRLPAGQMRIRIPE